MIIFSRILAGVQTRCVLGQSTTEIRSAFNFNMFGQNVLRRFPSPFFLVLGAPPLAQYRKPCMVHGREKKHRCLTLKSINVAQVREHATYLPCQERSFPVQQNDRLLASRGLVSRIQLFVVIRRSSRCLERSCHIGRWRRSSTSKFQ